jgi:hypothetical protein
MVIVVTAVGVPALMIGFGWLWQMSGYAINDSNMVSVGDFLIILGVLVYILETIYLYRYLNNR